MTDRNGQDSKKSKVQITVAGYCGLYKTLHTTNNVGLNVL